MIVQNGLSRPRPLGIGRPEWRAIPPETTLNYRPKPCLSSICSPNKGLPVKRIGRPGKCYWDKEQRPGLAGT
jgi:hypothetical protein